MWAEILKYGLGPRVDGYVFSTDAVGLQVWLKKGNKLNSTRENDVTKSSETVRVYFT